MAIVLVALNVSAVEFYDKKYLAGVASVLKKNRPQSGRTRTGVNGSRFKG